MKIVTVVGARPQFIKAATLSRTLQQKDDIREVIIHTGQHYDTNMSEIFFKELDIPVPRYNLGVGSGSHAKQTAAMLTGIEEVLLKEKPDWTLVYGDTNSTLAGSLAAVKLHIPVAHVEAGLRSFNMIMPEEINRIVTDRISDLLFAPTPTAVKNLETEGLRQQTVLSGDVMYDSILFYQEVIRKEPNKYSVNHPFEDYMLATVHRAENTDNPDNLNAILKAFSLSGKNIIWPVHPRTRKMITEVPRNVYVMEPVGYLEMINLTMRAQKVLTDSGGLQKEAYFLNIPCITLRTETEWAETVHDGWNTITGTDINRILEAISLPRPLKPRNDSFGHGNASKVITGHLLKQ